MSEENIPVETGETQQVQAEQAPASVESTPVEAAPQPAAEAPAQAEAETPAEAPAASTTDAVAAAAPERKPQQQQRERGPKGPPKERGASPQQRQGQGAPGGQPGQGAREPRREGGPPREGRPGGDRRHEGGERRDFRPGGRPEMYADIDIDKLMADPLYLDNQAHSVVSRMRDMDSGTRSQLRRFYNAVRRACRTAEADRQHQFVMLRARLAYTIARHSLRSLDSLERLLLQVTRKNDPRGYERFRDLFEAIVAYNE